MSKPDCIYILCDNTDEEVFMNESFFRTFEEALQAIKEDGQELGDEYNQDEGLVELLIREQPFGFGDYRYVYRIVYKSDWLPDDDDNRIWTSEVIMNKMDANFNKEEKG